MRQPGMMVDVGPGETTAQLLEQLNNVPSGSHLLLRLPKDARALRELDDFNKLRQVAATRALQLVIASPEKTVVGLARLLGFEVDSRPPVGGNGPAGGGAPLAPVEAGGPASSNPISENDWLFGAGQEAVHDDHVEAAGGMAARQPVPPPDVHIVGGSAGVGAPRATTGDDFDDIDAMNFDDEALERESAPFLQEIAVNTAGRTPERASEAEIAALQASLESSARPAPPKAGRATNGSGGMLGGLLGGRKAAPAASTRSPSPRATPPARVPLAPAAAPPTAAMLPASLLDDAPLQPQADAVAIAVPMPLPRPMPRPVAPARPAPRTGPITRQRPLAARRSAGLWVGLALLALLGVLLATAWGVITFLPQAIVSVIPATTVVRHPVEVPVSTTGTSLSSGGGLAAPAFQLTAQLTDTATLQTPLLNSAPLQTAPVAAQHFTANLSEEATVPTSGSREQPAGKDKIALSLVNPSVGRVVIGAGTEINGNGVTFRITQDTAVAGASDTGTALVYGSGSAEAEAVEAGPHTVGVGAVAGTFGNGLRYRNTTSAEGGYMEQIATVAQADVDRLRGELLARLQGKINGAILDQVPKELQVILPTLSVPDSSWKEELDHAVGDDATNLHMTMSVSGSVAAYNPADVEQAVKQVVAAEGAPSDTMSDPQLDRSSIQYGPLEMVGDAAGDQITYRTVTTATVAYNLTPEMQAQIKELVRGKSVADARAAVLTDPYLGKYISDITVSSGLSGLLNLTQDRVPDDPARIKVQSPEGFQP